MDKKILRISIWITTGIQILLCNYLNLRLNTFPSINEAILQTVLSMLIFPLFNYFVYYRGARD